MVPPRFSVVIPTFNRARRLPTAVASALTQGDDVEVVVVDDYSTDGTPACMARLEAPRVRGFRLAAELGVSATRNRGVQEARGEYVTFLDDDDCLRPEAMDRLRAALARQPRADFVWGGRLVSEKDRQGRVVTERRDTWETGPDGVTGTALLPYVLDIAMSCGFTMRRDQLLSLGGFDETFLVSEDRELLVRIALAGYRGRAADGLVVDIDEHFVDSLSRTGNLAVGPRNDQRIIARHRAVLERPEHREFLAEYLRRILAGSLQADDTETARAVARELRQRGELNGRALRLYLRHGAPFRWLKRLVRYDALRAWRHRRGR